MTFSGEATAEGANFAFGLPGVSFVPGDHICAFYRGGPERDEILVPYLREGLHAGDKCICVVDANEPDEVIQALSAELEMRSCLADHQIDVLRSVDAYLLGGSFSTERMIEFWDERVGAALADPAFRLARAVGEMTWSLREMPGVEELVDYEAKLNRFMPRYRQVILCLYDLRRFSAEIVMDMLRTHPKILVGSTVHENPYFVEPDEFLAGREPVGP